MSFEAFLRHVKIESDDRARPGAIPFELYGYQADTAGWWQSGDDYIYLKARQLGISWLEAAYKVYVSGLTPGSHSCVFSKSERESKKQLWRCAYIVNKMEPGILPEARLSKTEIEFANGSTILAFPSTEDVGISYTFQLVVADEAAFHPFGSENYGAYVPAIADSGQLLVSSTANPKLGPSGFFYDLWENAGGFLGRVADDGRIVEVDGSPVPSLNGMIPVFLKWSKRPGRDDDWREAQRKRYKGMPEAFDAYYPEMPRDAFVGKSGLVFPAFSPERHVRASDPVKWEECIARYGCYDLGGRDPTAIDIMGIYRRADGSRGVHQFAEFHQQTGFVGTHTIGDWFSEWEAKAPFDSIEPDPVGAAASVAETLRAVYGLPVRYEPVSRNKAERNRIHSLYLEDDVLTINEKCENAIREYASYRIREKTDPNSRERYATSTPVDHHGDHKDAQGGCLVAIYFDELNRGDFSGSTSEPAFGDIAW